MNNKKQLIQMLIACLLPILMLIWFILPERDSADGENPYEYDVKKLEKVPEKLEAYKELEPLNLESEKKLYGLALDDKGNIYITADNKLLIFDNIGKRIKEIKLDFPAAALAVKDSLAYLGMKNHVEVLDIQSASFSKWEPYHPGSDITSIAVSQEHVFVADAGNKAFYCYDKNGKLVSVNRGEAVKGFIIPSPHFDLALDSFDNLWVVNPGRHELENFSLDGKLISSWKKSSVNIEGFCGCCNPTDIAILKDGAFVTSEKGLPRIKVYEPDGALRSVVAAPDKFDNDTQGLDLAVDSSGKIYALDRSRKQLRFFIRKDKND